MDISFSCPHCGQHLDADESAAGEELPCPSCQKRIRVPQKKLRLKKGGATLNQQAPEAAPPAEVDSRSCPSCNRTMPPDAVVCVNCGWNSRTGKSTNPSGKPRKSASRRGGRSQWFVGTVAVIVLVVCGLSIYKTLTGRLPFAGSGGIDWQSFVPWSSDRSDARVVDWRVSATPVLYPSDRAKFVPSRTVPTPMSARVRSDQRPTAPLAPKAPPSQVASIQIRAEVELLATNMPAAIWPKATGLKLVRAAASDGSFSTVVKVGKAELVTAARELSAEARRGMRPEEGSRLYKFTLTDTTVQPGTRYFYKLEFQGAWGRTLATSGVCSAIGLPSVDVTTSVDAGQFPVVEWKLPEGAKNFSEKEARCLLTVVDGPELARFPLASGRFKVPLKLGTRVGGGSSFRSGASRNSGGKPFALLFVIEATLPRDSWSMSHGSSSGTESQSLAMPVTLPKATESEPPTERHGFPLPMDASGVIFVHADEASLLSATGVTRIRFLFGDYVRVKSVDVDGPGDEKESLWMGNNDGENLTEGPGTCLRRTYTYVWPGYYRNALGKGSYRTDPTDEVFTGRVSVVRAPFPTGLVADAGDGAVNLTWDPIHVHTNDWVELPVFSLRRSDGPDPNAPDQGMTVSSSREVYRGPVSTTRFSDTTVTNGRLYVYTLVVEGVTRATSWSTDAGEFTCNVPVRVASDAPSAPGRDPHPASPPTAAPAGQPALGRAFVIPQKLRPLRVAIQAVSTQDPRVNSLQAQCFRVLRETPWIELVERSVGASLLEEAQVAQLQSTNTSPTTASDVILQCRVRTVGYEHYFDVWFDDYKNSRKERLVREPLESFDWVKMTERLVQSLADRYPMQVAAFATRSRQACAPIESIAITDMRPLSKNAMPEGQFEGYLTAAIARDQCVTIVEREKLNLVLKELSRTQLTEQESAVRLGKLVTADAVLTGYYELAGDQIAISARLIDAGTGQIINVFDLSGAADDPQSLCQQLARQVLSASKTGRTTADSRLLRWMESQAYAGTSDKLSGSKTAAYVSPETPDHHFNLGQEQLRRGELEEALGSFYNGFRAEKSQDPWRFYVAIGELLDQLNRTEEAVKHWKEAIENRQRRKQETTTAQLALSRAYRKLNRLQEAQSILSQIPRAGNLYDVGRELEAAGLLRDAVATYGESVWASTHSGREQSLGPSYAALVRLVHDAPPEIQVEALKTMARQVGNRRPHQTRKAIEELTRRGVELDTGLIMASQSSPAPSERDPRVSMLEKTAKEKEGTVEGLRAMLLLGTIHRQLGDEETARKLWADVVLSAVEGQEADTLRMQAQMRMKMPASPTRPKTAPTSTPDPNAPPGNAETISSHVNGRLVVDPAAVVYRLNPQGNAVLWRYDSQARKLQGSGSIFASPVDTRTYSPSTGYLWYNTNHGIDHHISDLRLLASSMIVGDDVLYAPNLVDGTLAALDLASGKPRWVFTDWAPVTKPLFVKDRLFIGDSLGDLIELSPSDGKELRHIRYPASHLERGYNEQLLKLALLPSGDAVSFTNPRMTGTYRMTGGLREMEFESHNMKLDGSLIEVSNLSLIPYGTIPQTASISDTIVRIKDAPDAGRPAMVTPKTSPSLRAIQIAQARDLHRRTESVPVLLEIVSDATEKPALRAQAVSLLSESCGTAFLATLVRLADDRAAEVRKAAALALGRLGDQSHRTVLRKLLRDADATVGIQAVEALVLNAGLAAKEDLAEILNDPRSPLRGKAVMEMVGAGDRSLIPVLKQADPQRSYLQNAAVFAALCRADDPDAVAELKRQLDFTDQTVSPYTTAVFVATQLPEKRFASLVEASFWRVWGRGSEAPFIHALHAIGNPSSIPALIRALDRQSASAEIIAALEDLTGRSFGAHQRQWEVWWQTAAPSELRTAAAKPTEPSLEPRSELPIHNAVTMGDLQRVKDLLDKNPSLVNSMSDSGGTGLTPLHMAASSDRVDVASLLLARGADIDARWYLNGMTPLALALHSGKIDVAKLLITKGARFDFDDKGLGILCKAIATRRKDIVELLLEKGADVNAHGSDGTTPLLACCSSGSKEIAELLVARGAAVNAKASDGRTPLSEATRTGRESIAEFLRQKGVTQ